LRIKFFNSFLYWGEIIRTDEMTFGENVMNIGNMTLRFKSLQIS